MVAAVIESEPDRALRRLADTLASLPDEAVASGVITYSSGNHAQAVALAARIRGVRAVVVIVFDVSLISVLIFDSLVLLAAAFQHSNIRLPNGLEGALRRVIVTPSHHWVHHHAVRRDTDSNYGTVLTIWDRLFGSWSPTIRTPDMPIGTQGRQERSLGGLLIRPLEKP